MMEIVTTIKAETPVLKYQAEIDALNLPIECSCPPENSGTVKREGYRYIFENDPQKESHKPSKLKNPKRLMKSNEDNCSLCGLSCFGSKEQAIKNYINLIRARPNLAEKLGDSIASGILNEKSGIQTEMDEFGHFDLFEFATFDPYTTFMYVQKIELDDASN